MDAKEFRISEWEVTMLASVSNVSSFSYHEIKRAYFVFDRNFNDLIRHLEYAVAFGLSPTEPIPLTEEWLVKFGFVWTNGYGYRFINGWIKLKECVWKSYDLEVEIKHVHQLQNLYYALCQEELTIK